MKISQMVEEFEGSVIGRVIIGFIAVVSIAFLVIAGGGILWGLFLVAILGLAVFFGSLPLLVGSIITVFLLHFQQENLTIFFSIVWPEAERIPQLIEWLVGLGYSQGIIFLFSLVYIVGFFLKPLKFVSSSSSSEVNNKTMEE